MKINEQILNAVVVPRLNQLLSNMYINSFHSYEGYAVVNAQVRTRGEWLPVLYTLKLDEFRFDLSGRYVSFIYTEDVQREKVSLTQKLSHETEMFLAKNVTGKTLLMNALGNKREVHVSDNRVTIQLAPLVNMYPVLQDIKVDKLIFEEGVLHLEITVPPELAPEVLEFDWMKSMEEVEPSSESGETEVHTGGELIVLNREHERYYDQLRGRIEKYMREKIGDTRAEKIAPYLLLAPDLFVLLARLAKDRRVPLRSKSIALAALVYFMSPLDIIPEFIAGPGGFIDDIIFAVLALNKMLVDVDEEIIHEHWNGDKNVVGIIRDVLSKADSLVGKSRFEMIKNVLKKRK
ncbi:YkvA family protein [Aneurinibacillus thermoaerophilus]|uniref:YkvA family protein n=1 Tax=Aneurinibacillus thermoaerophilus TaxID=143495 RepID=UPI002E1B44D2|nr:YkvA family protein [Aneurinibacillus thermoaerophilus]MED0763583.1 YkvA family protein [Aneurinibacillus thermoaerophilus]